MPKLAANLTMLFNEVDFLDRFGAASRAGFSGVEYLFQYDHDARAIGQRLAVHQLTQVLFNLPAGNWAGGERGIGCLPDRVGEFKEGVDRALEYAAVLACKQINCLAGIPTSGLSRERANEALVANLRYAAERLQAKGIRLLIEAINTRDMPGFYLTTTKQALELIDAVGSDNLYVQYDIYHMQIMEGDLAPTIERNLKRIAHMQLADTPGRHEPGTGEINYGFLLDFVDRLGYSGWVGCEYKPLTTAAAGLGWSQRYLKPVGAGL